MKKLIFIIPVLALLLSACSEGKDPQIGPEGPEVARSYLKVALYAPVSSTRVSGYQDGTTSENYVNTVRFFFFKASGDPCLVFKQEQGESGTYLSYIDWTPDGQNNNSGDPDITVEKILTATLGLNQPANEGLPSLVLAVVNPTSDILALPNPDLGDLRDLVDDYYTGLYDSNFLITNSVYVNSEGNEITATPISGNNFGDPTDEESMANMETLNIFVERVLARLDFNLSLNAETNPSITVNGNTIYQVSNPSVDSNPEAPVYVQLLGWNVTATSNTSRAIKMINPDWNEEIFGAINNPWYISAFHRSYWAINPQELDYNYGDFSNAQGQPLPSTTAPVTVYLQENAADYTSTLSEEGPETPTCVIIGAQLVNATGQPLLLARWANGYYTQDNLLVAVANVLELYQQNTAAGQTSFTPISPEYLEFVSPDDVTLPDGETAESYYAYVQLNTAGQGITWYDGNTPEATALSTDEANAYILNRVNYVMVWTSGYTYYYFDIRHLGSEGNAGYYGIVRNHLYQANLTGITGLGTPVFDPEDVIYPTKPSPTDNTLNVQVNILQWRIVSQDYDLTWP